MSVFNDFQRLWMQRFPQSSLSEAWEQDVRASLERHRQKILDLTKELEQETLYVEYLERLLSDVEKCRESGGNPSILIEANALADMETHQSNSDGEQIENAKTSLNLTNTEQKDKAKRMSLNADNKFGQNRDSKSSDNFVDQNNMKDIGSEKGDTNTESANGALHQCITEIAASRAEDGANKINLDNKEQSIETNDKKTKDSHFVTVIEVKENKSNMNKISEATIEFEHKKTMQQSDKNDLMSATSLSSFEKKSSSKVELPAPPLSPLITSSGMSSSHLDAKKKMPPRPPPKNIRRVEPPTIPASPISSPKRDSPFAGISMPLPSTSDNASERTVNYLERNIKPSEILRQKSADNPEVKLITTNRKTAPETGKSANAAEIMEEFGRKIGKSESLEKTRRSENSNTQSPTGSLNRAISNVNKNIAIGRSSISPVGISPTNVKKNGKFGNSDISGTNSLDKKMRTSLQVGDELATKRNAGSKESLTSCQGISEIIKSYESVSSLGSDTSKHANSNENEPYYDTVPVDNGDGEYVYIKPGGTGSSSSRDDLSSSGGVLAPSAASIIAEGESPERISNYVNIDYFLQQSNDTRSSSLDSDGEYEGPPIMRTISHDEQTSQTPGSLRKLSGHARGSKIRSILSSIIQSEKIYVECLNKMLQYKRAIHATLGTSQPVIKEEEENAIFFKIDELYEGHTAFLSDLKAIVAHEGGDVLIGETFKRLADIFNLYSAFLHNYGQAIETVKKCSANNPQFKKIVSTIVLNLQTEQSLTLEDLLHKPVARVQINALVFNDLLDETPPNHPDHQPLRQAQKTIHMFLKQFNVVNHSLPTESNKNLRRMVKNSFIVELVDGHRKLRHLFLFNDVIACAKYKASGRDRIEYELKWFIPLKDVIVYEEVDANAELKESSPANILQLKTQACTVRDQLLLEEKDEKARKTNGLRSGDKYRRKLADLESQLVLASPNLVFRIGNKATNKVLIFFLSSDFERTQWIESILSLKQNCNIPGSNTINALDVHAFIVAMQKGMKTEMGSYLMRSTNDENLLVGDLHVTVQNLVGLEQPSDLYVCIEVDSYGHYFRKATTKMVCRSMSPNWNESFVIELEGSQNLRILLYEALDRPKIKAKYILKLSRSWLQETSISKVIKLSETVELNTSLRFVPGEVTLRRVPTSKPGALFGAKMSQVLKREKRDIPFIISACIREVERRGMSEVGIYRVSGSASDLVKLKKSFETNAYEAEQLLKEVDIHSVTGILKSYLRELPEALFSDLLYPRFFETFSAYSNNNEAARITELLTVFEELPQANKASINHILDHLIRVHHLEGDNKMSLHNLAMVFGPTLLRPGQTQAKQKDLLASSTVDVMAQAGILYCFLQARIIKD